MLYIASISQQKEKKGLSDLLDPISDLFYSRYRCCQESDRKLHFVIIVHQHVSVHGALHVKARFVHTGSA